MRSQMKHIARVTAALTLAISASACGGPSVDGTWYQENGTTPLPEKICSGGCLLDVEATMAFDDQAKSFQLTLNMAYTALHDSLIAHGAYEIEGEDMTLTFDGFTIDPASGNKASVDADGAQCIVLKGFASTTVCFPSPQTDTFTLGGDRLTLKLENVIAGAQISQTTLDMQRQEASK